ncbi:MAG: endopeptidase La [Ardenticatenaceae bacterium]|nr:endopeptidase La [Anaerolineales bacterium]MCB8920196.1 endopeptidase La [Ardenticatenaceae bacterium]MCB9004869.1 endopeptidase La [Ardenticatenaceae bacterium]
MNNPTNPQVPIIPLRGGAVFPGITTTITIGRRRSLAAAQAALEKGGDLLILVQYNAELEEPKAEDLAPIGILATVRDVLRAPHTGVQMLVDLHRRVRFSTLEEVDPHMVGMYDELEEGVDGRSNDTMVETIAYLEQYADTLGEANQQIIASTRVKETAGELSDFVAGLLNLPFELELELLTDLNGPNRLEKVRDFLKQELRVAEVRAKIQDDARAGADKAQRDFMLREQMRAIRKELGEESDDVVEQLRKKIAEAEMPPDVQERAAAELSRLEYQGPQSAEASVIRTYLEWLVELPWNIMTEDNLDITHVRQILDEDHYGLEDVKDRIVEYVAVRKLAGNKMKGAIINLNGPPGVGKTSIATSVARAIGREMERLSLGGVRDEAEIRGHRRTYIGAIPGRIIRSLRDAKTRNPVIVLDEIDKVGADWRGDPSSALLEVLDPEQNHSFTDHYLEVPFDLSQTIFITTSNQLSTIPAPLLDRMETITMPGYIEDDKLAIAQGYLLKKQLEGHGIGDLSVMIEEEAMRKIIRHYTREAGVRQLERSIGSIVRKLAVRVAGGTESPFTVTAEDITEFLGPEKFTYGMAEEQDEIGLVTGLAVNQFGGNILPIEVSLSEGNGRITLTGSLGDVMQESAQAALTYARANARSLGLKPKTFDRVNIHIHVPDGATPKDGPSAGISMATAVISAFTQRRVHKDVAMTGEVTLRGKILAIGGLKEKVIAAHRAGITTVIMPKDNAKDIPELPERVRQDITLIPVQHLDEVLKVALLSAEGTVFSVEEEPQPEQSLTVPQVKSGSGERPLHA